jgi:hypothetical protein
VAAIDGKGVTMKGNLVAAAVGFLVLGGADRSLASASCFRSQGGAKGFVDAGVVKQKLAELETATGSTERKNVLATLEEQEDLAARYRAVSPAPENFIDVTQPTWISVHLSNPPPARLRVSFDADGGVHNELEWDPAVSGELTRGVMLGPRAAGASREWRVTVTTEPSSYTQAQGVVLIHTRFGPLVLGPGASPTTATLTGVYVALLAAAASGAVEQRELNGWPAPQLELSCSATRATRRMEEESFAPAAGGDAAAGLRGFGVAPELVTETLSLLTEIAVDRAKTGAMRLLLKNLVVPFCGDSDQGKKALALSALGLGKDEGAALPRTCGVLLSLRLDDILSSGRSLLASLRDDLRFTVAPALAEKLAESVGVSGEEMEALLAILHTAIDRGGFDVLSAQAALDLASTQGFRQALLGGLRRLPVADQTSLVAAAKLNCPGGDCASVLPALVVGLMKAPNLTAVLKALIGSNAKLRDAVGNGCQVRLTVTAVKRCSRGGCTAASVGEMLGDPKLVFAVDTALPYSLCWTTADEYLAGSHAVEEWSQRALEGLRLVAPVVDGKGKDRAKAAVQLLAKLATLASGSKDVEGFSAFSEIAVALIDEDYGTALSRFVGLVELETGHLGGHKSLRKLARLIGAVATYASVYHATKDEDPKAARIARKQALSSIIDGATDRAGRGGDLITSIGSNVGISFTGSVGYDGGDDSNVEPGVRVPLGISLEWLPGGEDEKAEKRTGLGSWLGLRLGAQLADLGQFVRRGDDEMLAEVRWGDFVSPGIEAGVLIGGASASFNVSLHAEYAPTLSLDGSDGVWRYGISLGYYVPFFDLN